jgi:hypothetical protein
MMHEFNAACPVQLLLSSAVVAIAIFAERVRGEKRSYTYKKPGGGFC